jgi:hypothetical protein
VSRVVDPLAALARRNGPPVLDAERAREMVARAAALADRPDDALGASGHDRDGHTRAWRAASMVAAAAIVVLGSIAAWPGTGGSPDAPMPTRFSLPTGDELAVVPGSVFQIVSAGRARRLRVDRGAVSFDVRPLGDGESFVVTTPHLSARVIGTVFTIESDASGARVWVYEGRVEVEHDGAREVVGAGESIAVGAPSRDEADVLAAIATAAAVERAAERARASSEEAREERARDPQRAVGPDEGPAGGDPGAATSIVASSAAPIDRRAHVVVGEVAQDRRAGSIPEDHDRPLPTTGPGGVPGPTPADVRTWIARGDHGRALEAARQALAGGAAFGTWRLIEGDALRASGRFAEAVVAYELAARSPSERIAAGYLIAITREEFLGDDLGALDALAEHGCAAPGSPLAERALLLEARLLSRSGRAAEAAAAARAYLARFPAAPRRDEMRELASFVPR